MMKKYLCIVLMLILVATSLAVVGADIQNRQPDVFVNDVLVMFADQNAYITDEGRTLVPARGVFEAMDCVVSWDPATYTVKVDNALVGKTVLLTIDDTQMIVKDENAETVKILEVPATLMNNRTMIPLRAVSEAFGCQVEWDGERYAVDITYTAVDPAKRIATVLQGEFAEGEKNGTYPPVEISDVELYLKAPSSKPKVGDEVLIPVMAKNARDLRAIKFSIKWDPKLLQMDGSGNSDKSSVAGYTDVPELFGDICRYDADKISQGLLSVAGANVEGIGNVPAGDYLLGTLKFKVLSAAKGREITVEFDVQNGKPLVSNGEKDFTCASLKNAEFEIQGDVSNSGGGRGSSGSSRPSSGSGSSSSGSGSSSSGSTESGSTDSGNDSDDEPEQGDDGDLDAPAQVTFDIPDAAPGDTITVDVIFNTSEDANIFGLGPITLSNTGVKIVGFEFSDEAKEVINTGLSNFDPSMSSIVALFNEAMQFNGVIGTLTLKIGDSVSGTVKITSDVNVINEGHGNVRSNVVAGIIELG